MSDHTQRAHALLSASSSKRWLACPPSAVAAAAYENKPTEYAAEGTKAHEVAEAVVRNRLAGRPDETDLPAGADAEMIDCAAGYADFIEERLTGKEAIQLETRVDFSDWVPDGFGTCDCMIISGNKLTIIDYKYGRGVPVSAKDNPQMKLYALGAVTEYGYAYDVDTVEMIIYQPRLNNISTDTIAEPDLMAWADKTVKPTAEKAAKGKGKYLAGEHCRFCPHAGKCRALTKACTMIVEANDLHVGVPVLAPHEIAEILRAQPLIELWLKRVTAQAQAALLDGDTIPGWKLVEGRAGQRKWTKEEDVAVRLLEAGFGEEEITETHVLSPAAMDKAIGKKAAAELLTDLIDRAPGKPTLAPEEDKRPAYDPVAEAQKDFEN